MSDPTPSPDSTPHRRRPRYRGKNPRRFEEKYKEHDPERYADEVAKVLAQGKTPAGTHVPILVQEILAALALQPGEVAIDCTLGFGGHATEMLPLLGPSGTLVGLDVDPIEQPKTTARLRAAGWGEELFVPVRSNFAALPTVLAELGLERVDAILADLGVSSMQLDDPTRGFTFKADGPLDLRLNPARPPAASEWLARVSSAKLERALIEHADEPHAAALAQGLTEQQRRAPFERTVQLAAAVREIVRGQGDPDDAEASVRRVFQAIRIAVNDEFGVLDRFLRVLPDALAPGGRVAVLTFHSGEDRRVKRAFRDGCRAGVYAATNSEVVRASPEERRANPRSTSAKLRWAVKA